MSKRFYMMSAALVPALVVSAAVSAQDYLGVHLDTQREENLRRHQQDQVTAQGKPTQIYAPPISGPARHAAMRRHHREYSKIMKEHGYKAADRWLAAQVAAGR